MNVFQPPCLHWFFEVGPVRRHLALAVEGDVAQVGRALDVDQHVDRRDLSGRDGDLVTGRGDRRRGERVGRGAVRVDRRRDVVAAEEERAVRW